MPGLWGVDTWELTRIIREHGVMNAAICDEIPADLTAVKTYAVTGVVEAVTCKQHPPTRRRERSGSGSACWTTAPSATSSGSCKKRGCTVTVLPAQTSAEEVLAAKPDGVMLSNGPGDPAENVYQIEQIKKLLGKVPLFGICLGHQLTALAVGGGTYKLKYGHRGSISPSGTWTASAPTSPARIMATPWTVPACRWGKVRFINANDGTCEGIDYPDLRAFTVQFHPEACTGPKDTSFLFDQFVALMKGGDR